MPMSRAQYALFLVMVSPFTLTTLSGSGALSMSGSTAAPVVSSKRPTDGMKLKWDQYDYIPTG